MKLVIAVAFGRREDEQPRGGQPDEHDAGSRARHAFASPKSASAKPTGVKCI